MSGQVKQEGPSCWVWNKGGQEAETECVEVDVEFDDLGEEPVLDEVPEPVKCPSSTKLRAIELLNEDLNSGTVRVPEDVVIGCDFGHMEAAFSYARLASPEPKHTIPPLDPESALAKCHALIQEQATRICEEHVARCQAEENLGESHREMMRASHERALMRDERDEQRQRAEDLERSWRQAEQQLKTMTEDRDEYQAKYLSVADEHLELYRALSPHARKFALAMADATDDELEMTYTYIAKLMGEGRSEHGPLDLATDDRDLLGEGLDELDDVMSYLMMVKRRLEIRRKGDV